MFAGQSFAIRIFSELCPMYVRNNSGLNLKHSQSISDSYPICARFWGWFARIDLRHSPRKSPAASFAQSKTNKRTGGTMKKHQATTSFSAEAALTVSIVVLLSSLFFLPSFVSKTALAQSAGTIQVSVSSALPAITNQNASYSLEGAQFAIYSDEACTQLEASAQTDALGHAITESLPAGTYYVHQTHASMGFSASDKTLVVDVEEGAQAVAYYSLQPHYAQPDLLVYETNAETGAASPVAGSSLSKARFTISYYDKATDSATLNGAVRSWTFESDDTGEIHLSDEYRRAGAPLFCNASNEPVLPCGRYLMTVDTLPSGYLCEDTPIQFDVSADAAEGEMPDIEFDPIEAKMQIARGDVTFNKVDDSQNAMANIPFLLSYANGESENEKESHVVITDAKGHFSSESANIEHTHNTNANDAAVSINPDGSFAVDESKLSADSGVWFSSDRAGNSAAPDDSRCALPFGSYTLQELPCSANANKNLSTVSFSIYRDGFAVKLDTIVNTTPALSGSVTDCFDGDKLLRPGSDALVADTVSYRNLVPGQAYMLFSSIVCKDTGEHIVDANSEKLVVHTPIVPEQADGQVHVELSFDASDLAGRELTVHEEFRSETGMIIDAAQENEAERTIKVEPRIKATAFDKADTDNYAMGPDASIVERVRYEGLELGRTYTLTSTLMDKATGSAVRDAQGEVVSTSIEHVPSSYSESIDIEIPVDTTSLAGHDLVVFTSIQNEDGKIIANLQDMEASDLTVKTVKLTTSACDGADGDKLFDGNAGKVTIVDTVKYANLEPGQDYTVSGVLMDKETGKELIVGGKKVISNMTFTAQASSGSVDMEFSFDASAQTSDVLVAFETLVCNDNTVAEHADIEDVAQTVTSMEVDPEQPIETIANANGTGTDKATLTKSAPKTSDTFSRVTLAAAILIAVVSACIAYGSHRRTKTIETLQKNE